jgi:hypothetical protein
MQRKFQFIQTLKIKHKMGFFGPILIKLTIQAAVVIYGFLLKIHSAKNFLSY